ncbi:FYVE zinc finger-domain-containing protein [Mycotypha africana]|uniref:FYVE zinc finger-domain-containing protein n=1 Tax=Mycotypha africana TaxID=64632 RepID=UPI002300B005|nr:FYVE zinc finger-domain-containing protein [Mycotypha africana]KAI8991335.1 FYVE zinc finger-domain-containing protein [Mycotypha africana]
MTTGQQLNGFKYDDFVPTEGILCPICTLNCQSLENLNRHLDIEHSEEDSKGALLSWLKNAHKKVANSLSATATTTTAARLGSSPSTPSSSNNYYNNKWVDPPLISFQGLSFSNSSPNFFVSDIDKQNEYVTRDHWQRETGNDKCNIRGCRKIVGKAGSGKQHCRKCGRLFCDLHTQYEIKLNKQAQHDPEHGIWCKVCLNCFVHRKGYLETAGVTRNKTDLLVKRREKTIDRVHLECNRLEKRLEKLAIIHQSTDMKKLSSALSTSSVLNKTYKSNGLLSPSSTSINSLAMDKSDSTSSRDSLGSMLSPKSSFVSNPNSILSMKLKYRDGEQSVIKWEDDASVRACPYCESIFTLINRKHHCRLCGKVVCGNIKCSKMIPLFTDMSSDTFDDTPVGDTRACRDCQRYVFRRKLRNEEASKPLPIFQLYSQLAIARENIEKMLPKFHDAILLLEKKNIKSHSHDMFVKAAKIRKTLLDNFTLYDALAKSIRALPARSSCMKRLQNNICTAANLYLQQNMLPLQMLPRILKTSTATETTNSKKKKKQSSEKLELETQLQTYLEQYSLVEGFIKEANAERKYDDVKTLKASLDELLIEIKRLQQLLGGD